MDLSIYSDVWVSLMVVKSFPREKATQMVTFLSNPIFLKEKKENLLFLFS